MSYPPLSCVLCSFLICVISASSVDARQPDILLIVSEDNGPELGCYGDANARTPNLDRLASEGIRFQNAFVPQAGCSQSRASLLTGLYPHQHGQIGLATWGFRMYDPATPNLPRSLKQAGYRTGIIGKLHINPEAAFPFDFQEITGSNFNRRRLREYSRHAETFFSASEKPFFLSVNFPDAHDPWLRQVDGLPASPQTGPEVRAMSYMGIDPAGMREMVADYYNSLERLDICVGELLSALERSGRAANTLVIYMGDHGADMLRGKRTCYDGGLRVPLIFRWPDHIQPQARKELVSTIDLMPTILDAAGTIPVPDLPGRLLQPLFQETDSAPGWRDHLFAEYHTHTAAASYFPQRCVRTSKFKLIENLLPHTIHPDFDATHRKLSKEAIARGVPGGLNLPSEISQAAPEVRAAYALMRQPPRFELYDLSADPCEFRNLAELPEHTVILHELSEQLRAWRKETRDPLLDSDILQKLTDEVTAVTENGEGRRRHWEYPDYFFGREPARLQDPTPKKTGDGREQGKKR